MNFEKPVDSVSKKGEEGEKVVGEVPEVGPSEVPEEELVDSGREEAINAASTDLWRLYMDADKYNPFAGNWPKGEILSPIRESLNGLSIGEQENLAQDFFDKTIGASVLNTKSAYVVYGMFKGTAFGEKFRQLEDTRLKEAGYGGFNL